MILIATAILPGCIPRVPVAAPSAAPPSPSTAPAQVVTAKRLALDLSKLADRPTWEMRPVVARPVVDGSRRFHVVAVGDTGSGVAYAYRIPWSAIVAANGLAAPYVLRVGQRLLLPNDTPGGQVHASAVPKTIEARAAAFQIAIDDLVTGSEPARMPQATRRVITASGIGRFGWPVAGSVVARFGPQGSGRFNQGIDIAASSGAGVRATAPGTVAYLGRGVPGYGMLILLQHDGNWISAYARIGTTSIVKGETIRAGQIIGTADGTAPLHFELRRARAPVDPLGFLPPR